MLPFKKEDLEKEIELGYIHKKKHPEYPIYLYDYSCNAQFEKHWNDVTLNCRGLILDENYNVIAKPFPKFFNYEELSELNIKIPDEPWEIYSKEDGSLGILYQYDKKTFIATRCSFISNQAKWATNYLNKNYPGIPFNKTRTYLFEIIYPENRIVVDYKNKEKLLLLAILDNNKNKEYPTEGLGFETPMKYIGVKKFETVRDTIKRKNAEGFVIKFKSGLRVKMKYKEYVELHKIFSGINERIVIEHYINKTLDKVYSVIPDEMYNWVKKVVQDYEEKVKNILDKSEILFKSLHLHNDDSRKDKALRINTLQESIFRSILFLKLSNGDVMPIIHKYLEIKNPKSFGNF